MTTTTQTSTTTPQVIDFLRENKINYAVCNITVRNKKKAVQTYKERSDYPSKLKHSWTVYNKAECKEHNKYCKDKSINSVNTLPSQSGFVVVDFDSKKELDRVTDLGRFPMDGKHTLSCRNRLPHYYIKLTDETPMKTWRGKCHNKDEIELDIVADNVFEDLQTEVYGDFLPEMSREDLAYCLGVDNTFQNDVTYQERRNKVLKPKQKKIIRRKSPAKTTKTTNVTKEAFSGTDYGYSGELKDKINKNKGMEMIPYDTLFLLIHGLQPQAMRNHENWFKMVCAVANIVPSGTDPYKWLKVINDFCVRHEEVMCGVGNFDPKHNEKVFTEAFLSADSRSPKDKAGAGTLWKWLHDQNFDLWKVIAFNKYRPINPYDFRELELQDALKAFNANHSVIKGEQTCEVVSWDEATKSYRNMSTGALSANYQNLKYKVPVYYTDKDEKQIQKDEELLTANDVQYEMYFDDDDNLQFDEFCEEGTEPTPIALLAAYKRVKAYHRADFSEDGQRIKTFVYKKFIDEWLQWEGRAQYERDGFYPKVTPPTNSFNLFQGFHVENIEDYDHVVDSLSKEQLEEELAFMFQHIKYIMGNDKTDELYEFFMKYMAHLLKYPSTIPRVGWFIHGLQGSGKNQLLRLFEAIIGSEYCVSTTNANNLFGQFNAMINHKLIVNFNEIDNLNKYIEFVKSLTTDKDLWTTKKGKETKKYNNYARVFFFGNNSNKMIIGFSDRRWIVCETEIKQKFMPNYMKTVAEQVESVWIHKCMARYLKEFVKVSKNYDFEGNRPLTQSYQNVRARHVPYFHKFIKWMFETGGFWVGNNAVKKVEKMFSKSQLFKQFNDFLESANEKNYTISQHTFENDLDKFVLPEGQLTEAFLEGYVDKIFHKKKTDRWKLWIDKGRLSNFIEKHNYNWEDATFQQETDDEEDE